AHGDIQRRATHVEAVVDLFSDRGSIPRASTERREGRRTNVLRPSRRSVARGARYAPARSKSIWSRSRLALAPAPPGKSISGLPERLKRRMSFGPLVVQWLAARATRPLAPSLFGVARALRSLLLLLANPSPACRRD